MRTGGAILTGGRARRFGDDKAMALFQGRPLVAHIAERLGARVERLVTCGGPARLTGVRHLADWPTQGLGPLGGLCAALIDARDAGMGRVLSVGCDTPLLPDDLLDELLDGPAPAFVATLPLIGVWPSGDADALARWLVTDPRRAMRGWAERIEARAIEPREPIANVNTPDDLRRLQATRRRFQGASASPISAASPASGTGRLSQ